MTFAEIRSARHTRYPRRARVPALAAVQSAIPLSRDVNGFHGAVNGALLAIVRELAEVYGGTVSLSAAPTGGLRAELRLPGAADTGVRS